MRFLVIKLPWTKGAPTIPEAVAKAQYNFADEKARCLALLDEIARRDLNGTWPRHPLLGSMSGLQYSELQAKHLAHHLRQFSA